MWAGIWRTAALTNPPTCPHTACPQTLPFCPGEDCLIVANDWHSSLVPVLLKDVYQPAGEFKNTKVALCMHNVAFQGRFWRESWKDLGLPPSSLKKFEFEDGYPKVFDEGSPGDEGGRLADLVSEPAGSRARTAGGGLGAGGLHFCNAGAGRLK